MTLFSTRLMGQDSTMNTAIPMDSLHQFIGQTMRQSGLVGMGAALIVDKKVVWTKGFGYADKENSVAYSPTTIMNISTPICPSG